MKHYISEEDWQVIYSFLKSVLRVHIKNEYRTRVFIEAVWFLIKTGIQIRMLPDYYGNPYSIIRDI